MGPEVTFRGDGTGMLNTIEEQIMRGWEHAGGPEGRLLDTFEVRYRGAVKEREGTGGVQRAELREVG